MNKIAIAVLTNTQLNFTYSTITRCVTSDQRNYIIFKSNKTRVGQNSLANRLHTINGIIPLEWLNLSIESFKVRCKRLLL